jgi:hypothetical protein
MYHKNDNLFTESIEEIIKIKKCIYEGYKLNVAKYDNNQNSYISLYNNQPINIQSYLVKNLPILNNGKNFDINKPELILYTKLLIKKNNLNNCYEIFSDDPITVLSGFINIDKNFN